MGYPDIELARSRQARIARLIDEHAVPAADPRRLRRVLALCEELCEAVEDAYCRGKVRAVEECAAELLSAVHLGDVAQQEHIFMRWKERFLVPDHRVRSIVGASFEGFYYICFDVLRGNMNGIYYHPKSEK